MKRLVAHQHPLLQFLLLLYLWMVPHWWSEDQYKCWLLLPSAYRIFWSQSPEAVKNDKDKCLSLMTTEARTNEYNADGWKLCAFKHIQWVLMQSLFFPWDSTCKFSRHLLISFYYPGSVKLDPFVLFFLCISLRIHQKQICTNSTVTILP